MGKTGRDGTGAAWYSHPLMKAASAATGFSEENHRFIMARPKAEKAIARFCPEP